MNIDKFKLDNKNKAGGDPKPIKLFEIVKRYHRHT